MLNYAANDQVVSFVVLRLELKAKEAMRYPSHIFDRSISCLLEIFIFNNIEILAYTLLRL